MSAESPDPRARRRARAAQVARPACRRGRERAVEPAPELDRRGPARLPDPTGHERSRARAVRLRSASGAARNVGAHGYGPPSSHQHRPSAAASDRRASRLSPASSPVAVASPRAAIAAPRLPFRVRAAQLGALSDSGQAVGIAPGYFAEQGLDLQLVPFSSPSSALAALSAGQLEAASVPITAELFNALGRGSGLKVVAEA